MHLIIQNLGVKIYVV